MVMSTLAQSENDVIGVVYVTESGSSQKSAVGRAYAAFQQAAEELGAVEVRGISFQVTGSATNDFWHATFLGTAIVR